LLKTRQIIFVGLAFVIVQLSFGAQSISLPSTEATKLEGHIEIDGRLDEAAWNEAPPISLPFEITPRILGATSWATVAKVLTDGHALYVGVHAFDPAPGLIRSARAPRDHLGDGDKIRVYIDPDGSRRRQFEFTVNAAGAVADLIQSSSGQASVDWDGDWQAAATITNDGYIVEMRIPFKTLGIVTAKTKNVNLGFNIERDIGRDRRDTLSWSPVDFSRQCLECQLGTLSALEILPSEKSFRITPYVTWDQTRNYGGGANSGVNTGPTDPQGSEVRATHVDVGLDALWNISDGQKVLATIHPDFSQVPIDAIQFSINKRFALTYSENRPFFTEDEGMFKTTLPLVYTRSITDPQAGALYLDRGSSINAGAFVVADNFTSLILPSTESSQIISQDTRSVSAAGRLQWNYGDNSYLGSLITERESGAYSNTMLDIDGQTKLSASNTLTYQGAYSNTLNSPVLQSEAGLQRGQQDFAGSVTETYSGKVYTSTTTFDAIGKDFRADLGQLNQVGIIDFFHTSSWVTRNAPEDFVTRTTYTLVGGQQNALHGGLIYRPISGSIGLSFKNDASISAGLSDTKETYLTVPFNLAGATVGGTLLLFPHMRLIGTASYSDAIDFTTVTKGKQWANEIGTTFDVGRSFHGFMGYFRTDFYNRSAHQFTTQLGIVQATWSPTATQSLNALLYLARTDQSENLLGGSPLDYSKTATGQLVYTYQPSAFSTFYIGYNSGGQNSTQNPAFKTISSYIFAKIAVNWDL
jgi:hypothetical protein